MFKYQLDGSQKFKRKVNWISVKLCHEGYIFSFVRHHFILLPICWKYKNSGVKKNLALLGKT